MDEKSTIIDQLKEESLFLRQQNKAVNDLLDQYELVQYYNEQLYLKKTFADTNHFLLQYIKEFFRSRNEEICSAVYFVDEDGLTFKCGVIQASSEMQEDFDKELFVQAEKGVIAWSINNRKLSFTKALGTDKFRSSILIPLFGIQQFFGLILVYLNCGIEAITQETLKILNMSCLQAGLYIDNLRAYEKLKEYGQNMEKLVDERTQELRVKNQELRNLNEVKSSFISSVSHELRTPLTSILGFAKIVAKDMGKLNTMIPEEMKQAKEYKYVQRIESNAEIIIKESLRLTRLINDVLDLAKIESGKTDWYDQLWEAHKIVQEVISITQGFFLDKPSVQFISEVEKEDLGNIRIDKDKIVQVINNLISNSRKFTDTGYVKLKAFNKDEYIQVEVEDTGSGISEEDQKKIFKKFIQVGDTLTDKPRGTGLGLAICKEIVEHYRGKIWVESQERVGSTFKFILPLAKREDKN